MIVATVQWSSSDQELDFRLDHPDDIEKSLRVRGDSPRWKALPVEPKALWAERNKWSLNEIVDGACRNKADHLQTP